MKFPNVCFGLLKVPPRADCMYRQTCSFVFNEKLEQLVEQDKSNRNPLLIIDCLPPERALNTGTIKNPDIAMLFGPRQKVNFRITTYKDADMIHISESFATYFSNVHLKNQLMQIIPKVNRFLSKPTNLLYFKGEKCINFQCKKRLDRIIRCFCNEQSCELLHSQSSELFRTK